MADSKDDEKVTTSEKDENTYWAGFDLGGTKMLAKVFDDSFETLGHERKKTKGFEGAESGVKRIIKALKEALDESQVSSDQLKGIGIGSPGPLDLKKGIILEAPNLQWHNVPIKDQLEQEFGCPVVLVNDVDVGVYGESQFGAGKGSRCVLGIFPGTGVGGGCVYDGRIIQGAKSSCMELGHIPVLPGGPRCGCGLIGCLESVASRLAIAGQAAQAAYRGQAPALREAVGTDVAKIRSGVLASAIENGDKAIEQIVKQAATYIGHAAGGLIHLLSPDTIILGGGLVEAMPDLFVKAVEKAARDQVLPSFKETFKVKPAKLGDDATVLGAAAWCREQVEKKKR